jgi:hypothetical protein
MNAMNAANLHDACLRVLAAPLSTTDSCIALMPCCAFGAIFAALTTTEPAAPATRERRTVRVQQTMELLPFVVLAVTFRPD